MSEDAGGERASDEKNGPAETRPDDQLVGDDESGYGGAGADDVGAEHARLGNGHNRPPSDQDEDQGI